MALLTNTVKGSSRFGKKYRVVRQGGTTVHVYADGTKVRMPTTTRQRPADGNSGQKTSPPAPTHQQQVRANDRNPLYNPLVPLRGNRLITAARKLTNLETQPAIDAQKRALRDVNIQGKALAGRAKGYYTQLGQREGGDAAKQAAISAALDERLKAINADASGEIHQQQEAEQAREAADDAVRGSAAGANDKINEELAALASRTAASGARARTQGAEQSANYEGLTGVMAGARQLRGGEVQGELLNRLASAQAEGRGKLADLRSQRGNSLSKNVTTLRDRAFENILAGKSLGIKEEDIATGLQIARERNATSRKNAATAAATSRKNNAERVAASKSNAQLAADTSSSNTDKRVAAQKELARRKAAQGSPAQQAKAREAAEKITNAFTLINSGLRGKPVTDPLDPTARPRPGAPLSTDATKQYLLTHGYNAWQVEAAISMRHHRGYILPEVQAMIPKNVLAHIPKRYLVRRRSAAASHPRT